MDEAARIRFRQLIESRLAALAEEDRAGAEGQQTVALDQAAIGRLSRMDALQSQAMAKAAQARRDAQRAALRDALSRLGTPDFGYCEDCGEEIAEKRLVFDPSVRRCISCASG